MGPRAKGSGLLQASPPVSSPGLAPATGLIVPIEKPRRPAIGEADFKGAAVRDGFMFDKSDAGHAQNDQVGRTLAQIINPMGREAQFNYSVLT